jgi:hypothetical protein
LTGLALEAAQALRDGLERTLHVGLEDEFQRRDLAGLDLAEDVLQLHTALDTSVAALVREPHALLAGLADGAAVFSSGAAGTRPRRSGTRGEADHDDGVAGPAS